MQRAKLLQAELLLFVSGMVLCEKLLAENKDGHRAASGDFCWDPWLLISADAVPPLPFFQQTENREGMENFLSCLGIAPSAAGVAQLRKTVAKYLEKKLRYLTVSREDFQANFLCCLNLENWHDQFSRGRKAGSNDHR